MNKRSAATPVSLEGAATIGGNSEPPTRLSAALDPGSLLAGRYRIDRLLARGGMGEVHAAHDELLDIPLALKTLPLGLDGDPGRLRSFKRELLLARSIAHPNVCRVYALEVDRSTRRILYFLTMELLAGETLGARLLARGRLAPTEALPLVHQLVAALAAAHAAGVVHRDFKSANVMLVPATNGERAVVTDFGIARLHRDPSEPGEWSADAGTPAYMAPEQVRGESAGPAADVYALGVVLFEMLTGTLPFAEMTSLESARRKLTEPPPSPGARVPELDERWERTILRCLACEPGDRFARVEEVADALTETAVAVPIVGRHVLPAETDAFVGRGEALAELAGRLASGARLVTLLGTGGTGKTRLAIHHGWRARARFAGGVWFCDLTEARSLDGTAAAVANGLSVPLGKDDPVVQLGHAIAGRGRALFILDNFEQVVEHAAATVGRWLERAPEASFVVTSRERLGLAGEELQALGPLDQADGVALFLTRARAYRPRLGDEASDLEAIRQIVRLVDGLPLAIELAAARVRMLSVGQIVERLRHRFRLLADGNAEGRHATLAAAIDWSWELLRPWEQAAFAQASVFDGGFTLEAAEAVLDLNPWPEAPWVMDVVQSLVDKSLVRMSVPETGSGEPRFTMYVSLQEYARKKLCTEVPSNGESGAEAERITCERHGRYYARFGTDQAIDALDLHGGVARRRALAAELDNLVSACLQAVGRGDGPIAVATFAAAWTVIELKGPFYLGAELGRQILGLATLGTARRGHALRIVAAVLRVAGRMDEARKHLEEALAIAREVEDRNSEGIVLGRLGNLHHYQGRMEEALRHFQEAIAIHREVGNRRFEGIVLRDLGMLHKYLCRMEESLRHYQEALAIHREVGDRRFEGIILGHMGILHQDQGRMEAALRHFQEALAIHREIGDRRFEGSVLGHLGSLHYIQGRMEEALRLDQEALTIHREVGNRGLEGNVLACLGHLHQDEGRAEEALRHYREALAIAREVGDRRSEGDCLGHLGVLHARQGRIEEARAALAAGEALLRALNDRFGLGLLLCDRGHCERLAGDLRAARERLSEVEAILPDSAVSPESHLGKEIAKLRAAVDAASAPRRD